MRRFMALVFYARLFMISSAWLNEVCLAAFSPSIVLGPRALMVFNPVMLVTSSLGFRVFLLGSRWRKEPPR